MMAICTRIALRTDLQVSSRRCSPTDHPGTEWKNEQESKLGDGLERC